jgi:phosphatidylserine/phosphatidylglycerophosphate/cardiolipin synthase-like enzyme
VRRLIAVLLPLLVLPSLLAVLPPFSPADAASSYKVQVGPFFNDPRGSQQEKFAIERQVLAAINATPRKQTIRMAIYSFDRMPVAEALARAKKRGVKVQLLLNDHQDTKAMKYLRARLGTNRWASSFIYKCDSSCRGTTPDRNLHSKFYLFTRAGKSKDVVMFGSANMMLNAEIHQWNDLYVTAGKKELFAQYVALFNDMKHDWSANRPSYTFCGTPKGAACDDSRDRFTVTAFPRRSTAADDPVLTMLDRVQCVTGRTRTRLELSMHTMRGARGDYLARALRDKYAEGCDVRVSYGLIGFHTKKILGAETKRGRIPLRSTGFDFNGDDEVDLYTHQKYLVVRGTYAGRRNTSMVLTGSSNWASLGTAQDEIFATVKGAGVARAYVRNFNEMWRPANSRNAYTTTYSSFPGVSTAARTGSLSWVTGGLGRTLTVEPDPVRARGAHWESD